MADIHSTIIGFMPKKTMPRQLSGRAVAERVFFNRKEFEAILNIYGVMVAAGHWKDYAIDSNCYEAIFSAYQNGHDRPLYQIIKTPQLKNKQGVFSIRSGLGKILKRGHEIDPLLLYFNKALITVIR